MPTRPLPLCTVVLLLGLTACKRGADPLADDEDTGAIALTVAPIDDQVVLRNILSPRAVVVDVSVQGAPQGFDVRVLSSDRVVLADQALSCPASPCSVTLIPSAAATARISVGIEVTAGDRTGESSFGLDVVPMLVHDPSDAEPPVEGSLREVLGRALDGDVVGFDVAGELANVDQITLTRPIVLTTSVTLEGPQADRMRVDGGGETALFVVTSPAAVRLSGLTLAGSEVPGGDPGGAVTLQPDSSLVVQACRFVDNHADQGAAIHNGGGTLEVRATEFRGNEAEWGGGAILHDGPSLKILAGSIFAANRALFGGAVRALSGAVEIADGQFGGEDPADANVASEHGGAVDIWGEASLDVATSTFLGNRADVAGGALEMNGTGDLSITAVAFDANSSSHGAGARITGGTVTLQDTEFVGQIADQIVLDISAVGPVTLSGVDVRDSVVGDGVVHLAHGDFELDDVELSGNQARDCFAFGGGLAAMGDTVVVTNSRLLDNACADGPGGALFVAGIVSVTASEIRGNSAPEAGHAVYVSGGGDLTLMDTIVAGNGNELGGGGGAYVAGSGRLILDGGTEITENQAANGAGVYVTHDGTLVVGEARIADNTASEDGGGIFTRDGDVSLSNATVVSGNRADVNGGGIFQAVSTASLSLAGATVQGNSAGALGGGLYLEGGALSASIDAGITGNHASTDGGGLYWRSDRMTFDCTFPVAQVAGNTAGVTFSLDNISPDPQCAGEGIH